MIKTIVREHHWPVEVINNLTIGSEDYPDIEFFYNDIVQVNRETIEATKGKGKKGSRNN